MKMTMLLSLHRTLHIYCYNAKANIYKKGLQYAVEIYVLNRTEQNTQWEVFFVYLFSLNPDYLVLFLRIDLLVCFNRQRRR